MGASLSISDVVNTTVNETTTDILTENNNDGNQTSVNVQILDFSKARLLCKADISQTTNLDIKSVQNISDQASLKLIQNIVNNLDAKVKENTTVKTQLLSQPTFAVSYASAKNDVENKLKTTLTTTNINKLIQDANNLQTGDFSHLILDPCNSLGETDIMKFMTTDKGRTDLAKTYTDCIKNTPCVIDQNISVKMVSNQVTKMVTDIITNSEAVSKFKADLDQVTTADAGGFAQLVGALGWAALIPCIICMIVCVACIVALYYLGQSPAGQSAIKTGSNTASSVAKTAAFV